MTVDDLEQAATAFGAQK